MATSLLQVTRTDIRHTRRLVAGVDAVGGYDYILLSPASRVASGWMLGTVRSFLIEAAWTYGPLTRDDASSK
jgi:hypothetical protein